MYFMECQGLHGPPILHTDSARPPARLTGSCRFGGPLLGLRDTLLNMGGSGHPTPGLPIDIFLSINFSK
jgi:hypothetical protein